MYESFFGLQDKPFRIVADPDYLYLSPKHQRALTFLEYGLMEDAGVVLMTGEPGSGKTTLIRHILKTLKQTGKDILPAVVLNVNISNASETVDFVLHAFGLVPETSKGQSLRKLRSFLLQKHQEGKKSWLIIDEAQNLSREALEEVRMLSNLQSAHQTILHIMLVGQSELKLRLRQPDMVAFSQRIAVYYHIEPLTAEEVQAYIVHRLRKAGGRTNLFDPEAVNLIFQASGGITRTINMLCDAAMVYGYGYELARIDANVIVQVIKDKEGMGLAGEGQNSKGPAAGEGKERTGGTGPDEGASGRSLRARIDTLERRVEHLQRVVEGQMAEIDKRVNGFGEEKVLRLKELLLNERKRSDKLLIHYTALKTAMRKQNEIPFEMPLLED
jgi:general secretion pathway protein A